MGTGTRARSVVGYLASGRHFLESPPEVEFAAGRTRRGWYNRIQWKVSSDVLRRLLPVNLNESRPQENRVLPKHDWLVGRDGWNSQTQHGLWPANPVPADVPLRQHRSQSESPAPATTYERIRPA